MTDEPDDNHPLFISCARHGPRQVSALVCGHMLKWSWRRLGFIENNDHPNNLQAWCEKCERVYLEEGDRTEWRNNPRRRHGHRGTIKQRHER